MAQTSNQDEDLLILSDETDTPSDFVLEGTEVPASSGDENGNSLIFDTGETGKEAENNVSLISDDSKVDSEAIPETGVSAEGQESGDNNFNFSFNDSATETEDNETLASENNNSGFDFTLGGNNAGNGNETGTMTDILDETISKFEKRGGIIDSELEKVNTDIKDLKSQISSLEEQVTEKNSKGDELKAEKTAIQRNIKSIEKMKNEVNNPSLKS